MADGDTGRGRESAKKRTNDWFTGNSSYLCGEALNAKIMGTSDVINKLREIKPYLQKEYAVKTVGLFGSFADGAYTDSSDIDIMVEFERPIGWHFFSLEKYLEEALHRQIDLVTASALKEPIKPFVLSQIQYI